MTFKFDEDYRASDEYKEWVAQIRHDYPSMPLYLIEAAILSHKTNPQAYKSAKDAKEVFSKAPKAKVNEKPATVEGAIKVEDAPPVVEESSSVIVEEVSE